MAVRKKNGWWYAVYPNGRNSAGKITYTERKVSKYKKTAEKASNSLTERFKMLEAGLMPEIQNKRLGEILEWFLTHPKTKNRSSLNDITRYALNAVEEFGSKMLVEISPTMIERWHERLKEEVSVYTANRNLATFKRWMNLCVREGWLKKNPCFKVEMFKETPRKRVITHREFMNLTQAMAPHASDISSMAYYTGMRKSEILNLEWPRVSFSDRAIYLADTKNGEARVVPFNHLVLDILRRLRFQHERYVFTYNGQPINSIKTAFNKACKRAGLEDFRFHDLRHCFRTNLRKAGVDRSVSMEMTGHKSLQAHEIYNTIDREDVDEAYELFEKRLSKSRLA